MFGGSTFLHISSIWKGYEKKNSFLLNSRGKAHRQTRKTKTNYPTSISISIGKQIVGVFSFLDYNVNNIPRFLYNFLFFLLFNAKIWIKRERDRKKNTSTNDELINVSIQWKFIKKKQDKQTFFKYLIDFWLLFSRVYAKETKNTRTKTLIFFLAWISFHEGNIFEMKL